MSKTDAIVLAGAPAEPELAVGGDVASRAMVHIGAKTMLQWVVDALRGASSIGRIVAVGNVSADGLDRVIAPGDNLVDNIKLGIEELDTSDNVLVASSDIPLLTSDAVDDFIGRAVPLNVDLAYPIVPKSRCESLYPGLKRTCVKTADGTFTGGNIMLLRPSFVAGNYDAIARVYAARKQVFKLARMIGIGVLARVIIAQAVPRAIGISALEHAAGRMLNADIAAVVSDYPEIGEDVDKLADLEAVRRILA